jgi:hypothetical protein
MGRSFAGSRIISSPGFSRWGCHSIFNRWYQGISWDGIGRSSHGYMVLERRMADADKWKN